MGKQWNCLTGDSLKMKRHIITVILVSSLHTFLVFLALFVQGSLEEMQI